MHRDEARLGWLLDRFARDVPGVRHVQTVSADGMHLASSADLDATAADSFAAVTSGLTSLCETAGDIFRMHPFVRQIIETGNGWILLSRISSRASLAVITEPDADLGLIGYEMTVLTEQAGQLLSPELIQSVRNPLDR